MIRCPCADRRRSSCPRLPQRGGYRAFGVERLVLSLEPTIAARPEEWLAFRRIWLERVR